MSNLWEWLLQTLSVTLVAALLLLIKRMLEDKLSPRWQYGVWCVLALRILLPVRVQRTALLPLPLWVEVLKFSAEAGLSSAYAAPYVPLSIYHMLPIPHGAPQSITDWLFVILAAGTILCALWYLLSYLRLRCMLRRGTPVRAEIRAQIEAVCAEYGLKSCRAVEVKGLPSAFVCGVIRPVLALPADRDVDDKILLHELLHLKYRDAWQNIFWCALRCLHWFNPLIHIVINRIENDMESLCDQRVLERLVGEERRAYGNILLAMANDRFARAPGSSSISNGGKNISRRIAAIVRFKKYPRGMALVSVCIVLVLLAPTLIGSAHTASADAYQPDQTGLTQAMALSRIRRCATVAGAIDTYAKGLLLENGVYIATASPLSRQEELAGTMSGNQLIGKPVWFLDAGDELEDAYIGKGYAIYDLTKQADGSYLCYLRLSGANSTGEGTLTDSAVVLTLRLFYDHGWCAEEVGERTVLLGDQTDIEFLYNDALPFGRNLTAETEHGTLILSHHSMYHIDNMITTGSSGIFGGMASSTYLDTDINPNIEFESFETWTLLHYTVSPDAAGEMPQGDVSLKCAELSSADEKVDFPKVNLSGSGGGAMNGCMWENKVLYEGWDGTVSLGTGTQYIDINNVKPDPPSAFWVQILWDHEVVEELILEEVAP